MGDSGFATLGMVGASVMSLFHYGMRHRDIANHYMATSVPKNARPGVVANLPLRSFNRGTSYENFNQTTETEKDQREEAIVGFVKTVSTLHQSNKVAARFLIDSNVENQVASKQAPVTKRSDLSAKLKPTPVRRNESLWWIKRYRIQTLFPDEEKRWLPISFFLAATDRTNESQYLFHGAVKSLTIESDVDLLNTINVESAAIKLTFTLVDTNWENLGREGAPKEFKYVATQENSGAATSAVLDKDGKALPIFVSSFGFRLEEAPVAYDTDVWTRFRKQGLGFSVNAIPTEDELNPTERAYASVRFHDNAGAKLTFVMRALPLLFNTDLVTTWNEKSGNIFVHSITPKNVERDALPLVIHVGTAAYRVGMIRIGTNMKMRVPGDLVWDANTIKSLALETVDNMHEFVLDPGTGNWVDRDPRNPENESTVNSNTEIDLIVFEDMVSRKGPLSADVPAHGQPYFTNFSTRAFNRKLNFGLPDYLRIHAYDPVMSVFEMDNEINENWWYWAGTGTEATVMWSGVVIVLVCMFMGWTMRNTRMTQMAGRAAMPVAVIGLLFVVLASIYLATNTESAFVLHGDKLITYGALAVVVASSLYFMLCSRIIAAPPASSIIAIAFLVEAAGMAYMLRLNGRPEVLNQSLRIIMGTQAVVAALACFVLAMDMREISYIPVDHAPAISLTPGVSLFPFSVLFFIFLVVVVFNYTIEGWNKSCSRSNFVRRRAAEAVEKSKDKETTMFYREEYHDTEACDAPTRRLLSIFILLGVVMAWVSGPLITSFASRLFIKDVPGTPKPIGYRLMKPELPYRLIQLVLVLCLLALVAQKNIEDSKALERGGEQFVSVCEDARDSLHAFNNTYIDNENFDAVNKKAQIVDGMTSMECIPDVTLVLVVLVATILFFWIMALSMKPHMIRDKVNVWSGAFYALFLCIIIYFSAWFYDDDRRLEVLDINFAAYFNKYTRKLYSYKK